MEELRMTCYKGTNIQYTLERKKVKNINLRIRADGSVYVSANHSLTDVSIDSFIQSKGDYILKALQRFKELEKYEPMPKKYVSGETFVILGRGLRLKVIQGNEESVTSDGVYIFLTVRDKNDSTRKERLVRRYLDSQCKIIFADVAKSVYSLFRKYNVEMPQIRIREMKTRWGSCLPKKGIITLNARLLEAPLNCIEYVVLHEFCHFIQPNHSKRFYDLVAMFMPDWRERKQALEKQGQHSC